MRKKIAIPVLLLMLVVSACARKTGENFYFGSYSEAEALYNRGEYQKAVQKYRAYIDENPEGNLALISQYYIARSQAALGQIDEAKSLFQKIVNEHQDTVWANFSETQLKELEKLQSNPKK